MPRPATAPSTVDLVTDALAVARLTRLAQHDEVWPAREVREWFVARTEGTRWQDLAYCPWCLSCWVAVGVVVLRWRFPRVWPVLSRILAGSQVTGMAETWIDRA